MQFPAASCPRKTLNPNVNFPVIEGRTTAKYSGWTASSGVSGLLGGSMRPPPVHFPVGHWAGGGTIQKAGRFGAMLTFGWSVHAAASSPAAMRLGQTIRLLCSRIMCVLPSSLSINSHELLTQSAANAKSMPSGRGGEPVEGSRLTEDVAPSRRCACSDFACAVVACARDCIGTTGGDEQFCEQSDCG